MIPESNLSGLAIATKIGILFGLFAAAIEITITMLYVLDIQSIHRYSALFGGLTWCLSWIAPFVLLYFYRRELFKRLGWTPSLRLVMLAGVITGFCSTLILTGEQALIEISNARLFQELVDWNAGPVRFSPITPLSAVIALVGVSSLFAVLLILVVKLAPRGAR
jgi:hypothetical protein